VLLFSIHKIGKFEMAANHLGRLHRAWPKAIFLLRRMAKELSVPFAQYSCMEEYLDDLLQVSQEAEHAMEEHFDARTVALTSPFREPSNAPARWRAQDAARIYSRGLIPTAWCSGVIRAPCHFDLSWWFPRYLRWWLSRAVLTEMPYAFSSLSHKLVEEFCAAWLFEFSE